jgi:hypothetical protein
VVGVSGEAGADNEEGEGGEEGGNSESHVLFGREVKEDRRGCTQSGG